METCREAEEIELTTYLSGLDKELHTLCYRCVNAYKFPVSKHVFKYFYNSSRKELTIEPFKNGIIKNLEIKTVEIDNYTSYYVGIEQTKNILSYLVMNNFNIFLTRCLLEHKDYLPLNEEVFNKIKFLEKITK